MRFNFDLTATPSTPTPSTPTPTKATPTTTESTNPRKSLTPQNDVEWVPLHRHPLFSPSSSSSTAVDPTRPSNLIAWDGSARLYFWDNNSHCLHRLSIRLGEPEPTSVLAASPAKVLRPDSPVNIVVNKISINGNGSALLLAGSDGLCVMYLYGRMCTKENAVVCRTISVGSQIYFKGSNEIRTLQASWHPYSDTHLGILSSDSVFRLFDLSLDVAQPEQEYYLEPKQPGRSRKAASICPVDFSFGGDHLWDRFSVFVLFNDGAVYVLCPIIPFGSVCKWESILEMYNDAHTFGLKSSNSTAVRNSNLAISWLEGTFPDLASQEAEVETLATTRAHPFAIFDASISLQGPLYKVCHGGEEDLAVRGAQCEGRAVSFLYNLAGKDSIMVTAWSGGQLQIDALADEIQPAWNIGVAPSLRVDSNDCIVGLAMICESMSGEHPIVKLDQLPDHTVWLGHPPPLLRLAVVDLALPRQAENDSLIALFIDPVMPERIYVLHSGGIDSIVMHLLPFTSQTGGKDDTMRTHSVHPVLSTSQEETSPVSALCGCVSLADSFGYSWVVGVTSSQECFVLEMKTWNLLLPMHIEAERKAESSEGQKETLDIISKELLSGPKVVVLPQTSSNLRSVSADSIEGRSILHQYLKLFHENYVEYAHKVYFELKHHAPHLKRIIDDQHGRLTEAQQKMKKVEMKQSDLEKRIDYAIQRHSSLEERLQRLRNLPGAHKKPLSRAEREFKSELDQFVGVEMDALHSSIEALNARMKRHLQSSNGNRSKQQRPQPGKAYVQEALMSQLKSSLEKLSLVNSENTKKVKLVESALRRQETADGEI